MLASGTNLQITANRLSGPFFAIKSLPFCDSTVIAHANAAASVRASSAELSCWGVSIQHKFDLCQKQALAFRNVSSTIQFLSSLFRNVWIFTCEILFVRI